MPHPTTKPGLPMIRRHFDSRDWDEEHKPQRTPRAGCAVTLLLVLFLLLILL